MNCSQLSARLEQMFPSETPQEIARVTLLMLNRCASSLLHRCDAEVDDTTLLRLRQQSITVVDACSDQHEAMTEELESLCNGDTPVRFHPDQIWTLLRAIKVQSQMLELYLPVPATGSANDDHSATLT